LCHLQKCLQYILIKFTLPSFSFILIPIIVSICLFPLS
jgi:hypothetical protein